MDHTRGGQAGDEEPEERLVGGKSHRKPARSRPSEAFANKLPLDTAVGGSQNATCGGGAHPVQPKRHGHEEFATKAAEDAVLPGWHGGRPWQPHWPGGARRSAWPRVRDVLGRSGGGLLVRMVQALMVMTMQGCSGPDGGQAGVYLEAVLFYFLEVFYNNPVFFLAALLTYVLVTSRWTLSFSVSSRGPAGSDAATQTDNKTADKKESKPKGTRPNKQPEKETKSQREPPREPETLEEARQRLHETLTYEDLFTPGPGLEQATEVAPEPAASASSSATRFPSGRSEARVALSVQRRGFLECATKCLSGHDLDTECWVTEFGYAYHRRSCSNLKHAKNVKRTTAREAIENGKAACNQCFADHWVPTVKYRFPGLNL